MADYELFSTLISDWQEVVSKMDGEHDNTERDWFELWFDSPLYELLYADRNQGEAERLALLISKLIPVDQWPLLLDLGCGRGRHSLSLARLGYKVIGLDLSEPSILTARERASSQGVEGVRFMVGDMREPLSITVDAVVNLFTSFGYFESDAEHVRVLENMHGMLRPGGRLLLDYFNAVRVRATFEPADSGSYQGLHYTIRRYVEDGAIHKKIQFEGDNPGETREYEERVKLYGLEWFEENMRKAGLRLMNTYGGYGGEPFDPDSSSRLLILAERPGSSV